MPRKKSARKATKMHFNTFSSFDLYVNIPLIRRKFKLPDLLQNTKIIEIKQRLELVAGIPTNLQRLQYLDKEDLTDKADLRSIDIVPASTLTLQIWRTWERLVSSVAAGDLEGIINSEICGSHISIMDAALMKLQLENRKYRLGIALFLAAHSGQRGLVEKLIERGADKDAKTTFGRTALHAAAASGSTNCIDLLLAKGACNESLDHSGKSASAVANEFGNRESEKSLFLFQWQKRVKSAKPKTTDDPLMMHQQFDSGYPIWRKGKCQQVYLCQTLPAGEFTGTSLSAPRTKPIKPPFQDLSIEELAEMRKKESLDKITDPEEEG